MRVIIEATITPAIYKFDGLAATLRIEAIKGFTTADGQTIPPSNGGSQDFFLEVPITIANDEMVIPSFEIDSTEDAYPWDSEITGDVPGYRATIVLANGRKIPYYPQFKVPTLIQGDPSLTWAEIRVFNRSFRRRFTGLDRMINVNMAQEWIQNAVGELNRASETNTGVTALTVDPVDPIFPIAVAANDPAYLALLEAEDALAGVFTPEQFGAVGDGVTDDTVAFQLMMNALDAAGGGIVQLGQKEYIWAGPLQDPLFSNSQVILPKRNPATQEQITIRFVGVGAPIPFPHANGTIIRSTLNSGNGSMLSVKCNWGSGTATQAEVVANHRSSVSFQWENITWRMVGNPTNSCLDLRFIPHFSYRGDTLIDVDGIGLSAGSITVTEPTTPTSYGLLTPIDFCSAGNTGSGHLLIIGYYNGMALGELFHGVDVEIAAVKVGVELRGGSHANHFDKLLIVSCATLLKTTGRDPVFAPVAGAINTCLISIDQLDFENGGSPVWTTTNPGNHLSDSNNYLTGEIVWSSTLWEFTKTGGVSCKTHPLAKPWHSVRPFTNATGVDLDLSNHAVDETYRGLQVSSSTGAAWKLLTNHQSGLNNLIGVLAFVNDAIANGNMKALAWLTVATDAAINSGRMSLDIMNAGVIGQKAAWDRFGNYSWAGFLIPAQGNTLTITGGSITPLFSLHTVQGAGPLTTIVLPSGVAGFGAAASCIIDLIPAANWDYNNTGNILGSGTALANKKITATWLPSISKWSMSY